jgi:hypothetical protein
MKPLRRLGAKKKRSTSEHKEFTMLDVESIGLSVEFEEVYVSNAYNTTHNNLLLAVLERAVMDLFIDEVDRDNAYHKSHAVYWFLAPETISDSGFSFQQIVTLLGISSRTVNRLKALAIAVRDQDGEYYDLYIRYRSRYNGSVRSYS